MIREKTQPFYYTDNQRVKRVEIAVGSNLVPIGFRNQLIHVFNLSL